MFKWFMARNKVFRRALFGLSEEDVREFQENVADQLAEHEHRTQQLEKENAQLQLELLEARQFEYRARRAAEAAEQEANNLVGQRCATLISEAETRATDIITQANSQASDIIANAEKQVAEAIASAQATLTQLTNATAMLQAANDKLTQQYNRHLGAMQALVIGEANMLGLTVVAMDSPNPEKVPAAIREVAATTAVKPALHRFRVIVTRPKGNIQTHLFFSERVEVDDKDWPVDDTELIKAAYAQYTEHHGLPNAPSEEPRENDRVAVIYQNGVRDDKGRQQTFCYERRKGQWFIGDWTVLGFNDLRDDDDKGLGS